VRQNLNLGPVLAILILVIITGYSLNAFASDKISNVSLDTVTVITKSQIRYENVVYRVDSANRLLIIYWQGWGRPINFVDIDTIYNNSGADIKSNIVRNDADNVTITSVSEYLPGHENEYKTVWKGFIRGGGNFSVPVKGYNRESIGEGIGYEGDIHLALDYRTALRLMVSKSGLRLLDKDRMIYADYNTLVLNKSINFSIIRYTLSIENYGHFDRLKRKLDLWYICLGAGVIRHSLTAKATFMDLPDSNIYKMKESEHKSEPVIIYGMGVIKDIGDNAGIDFSTCIDMVLLSENESKNSIALILDFKIALVKFF
jgi:hypothetical protein